MTDDGLRSTDEGLGATLPIAEVSELVVTLGKALRASQLYDENNPVYKRFVTALSGAFTGLWGELDQVVLHVQEDTLLLEDEVVYRNANRSESIAFLLFKDGVRLVHFLPGFESQVPRFLHVLNRARHARQDDADLLTLLWEADLDHFKYRYVDLLAEGLALPEAGMGASASDLREVIDEEVRSEPEGEGAQEGAESPPATAARDDFNPTLYALDASDMEELRREIRAERERDVRRDVLHALFDRFEDGDEARRDEIFDILRGLLPAFLARGEISLTNTVLAQVRIWEGSGVLTGEHRERMTGLLNELSTPEALEQLIEALEVGSITPSADELGGFLEFLRGGALGVLVRATFDTDSRELARVLGGAVESIAQRNPGAVVSLLASADPVVAAAAARIVGEHRIHAAAGGLRDLLYSEHEPVREAAVDAVGALQVPTLMGPLVDTLLDPEPAIRIAAARVLGQVRYRPATDRFREILDSREIRQAERSEKIAFFEAYGRLGDPGGIEFLDRILNGKGFLGRREPPEIRASAALGLGRFGVPAARAALEKAEGDDDPIVRSAVIRAIAMDGEAES
ncbi:MAG: HEAT repeat domain-containing protein [Longimicrobiales bacterium]|nr:HEAT repeat domain-containing protein [Longimicrobiales bacterium]